MYQMLLRIASCGFGLQQTYPGIVVWIPVQTQDQLAWAHFPGPDRGFERRPFELVNPTSDFCAPLSLPQADFRLGGHAHDDSQATGQTDQQVTSAVAHRADEEFPSRGHPRDYGDVEAA